MPVRDRIAAGLGVAALAVVAVGFSVRATAGTLGTKSPPFVFAWGPRVDAPWTAAAVLALALAVALLPRLAGAAAGPTAVGPTIAAAPGAAAAPGNSLRRAWGVAAALFAAALGVGLAVNAARLGPLGWSRVFRLDGHGSLEAANEYLPGLPSIDVGVRFYLDRFAELVPAQPVNVAGHPPGPLLLLHVLGVRTGQAQGWLCSVGGSLCAPLSYRLGWTLRDERTGRVAGVLAALSPVAVLWGVNSYDAVFAAFGAGAACLLVARSARVRALGCLALALAALMSWALLGVGAWAAIVSWRRDGLRAAVALAVGCALALVVVNGALALAVGYDPVGTLRATERVYRAGIAQERPYAFWVFGSPTAWLLMLGPPIVLAAIAALLAREPAALGLFAVLLVASVGGFTKAETERIWLFLVPLACAAAAPYVRRDRLVVVCGLLAAQTLVLELLVDTVW